MAGKAKPKSKAKAKAKTMTVKVSKKKQNRYLNRGLYQIKGPAKNELKYRDTVLTAGVPILDTGTIVMPSVNIVPQGDGPTDRQGNHIDIVKIQCKIGINAVGSGSATKFDSCTRVMLVLDREPHGALPSVNNILAEAEYRSWNNTAFDKRFLILKTWKNVIKRQPYAYHDGTNPHVASTDSMLCLKSNIKCALRPEWINTNTDGALTQLNNNNILLLAIVDDSTNATTEIDHLTTSVRIRFYD